MTTSNLISVIAGAICIFLMGVAVLLVALLHRLGKLTPIRWWGRSALAFLLFLIAPLAMGAGLLMQGFGDESTPLFSPSLWGTLIFIVALLGGILVESRYGRGK